MNIGNIKVTEKKYLLIKKHCVNGVCINECREDSYKSLVVKTVGDNIQRGGDTEGDNLVKLTDI